MIEVNGEVIPEEAVLAEMQYHPARTRDEAFAGAAEALVVRALLLQRAKDAGLAWTAGDAGSEEEAIERLLAAELRLPEIDADSCRRWFGNNKARYRSPDLFEASHILYLAPRDDEAARSRARQSAKRCLAALQEQPETFAALARAESRCASAGEGGFLGQLEPGETCPEIDTFLFSLEDGQLCPVPVETDYGVHVLKLHRRIEGRQASFADVAADVARVLKGTSWARAVSGYIALLAGNARIKGIEIRGAESPLVQ